MDTEKQVIETENQAEASPKREGMRRTTRTRLITRIGLDEKSTDKEIRFERPRHGTRLTSIIMVDKPKEPDSYKVFVYGSLRTGYHNHYYLETESEFIGKAKSIEKYSMTAEERYMRGYRKRAIPFVSKKPEIEITGEIFEVSKYTLKLLDALESHPRWYKREEVEFELLDAEGSGSIFESKLDLDQIESSKEKLETEASEHTRIAKRIKAWIYFNEETIGRIAISSGDFSLTYPITPSMAF